MPDAPEHHPYRIVLRPIANPLPLSLVALLLATTSVAALQLGWIPTGQSQTLGRIVLVLALGLQLPGALLGFLARDPAAGTGMAILAGAWLSVGLTLGFTPPGPSSPALGIVLVAAAVALVVPISAALGKPVTVAVFVMSSLRFAVTGISELGAPPEWETAAGVLGIVLGVVALYAAVAFQLEDVHHHPVLPLGRTGPAEKAMHSGSLEQVRGVEHEAGVRGQL